ncbi:MAG: glutamine synthetase type III, partial [Candidatus Methanomethylophilaceae archaeon]|nr:glutamine synthetase type III [Candidatus Methanomethylophilaceae archaeon]
APNQFELAPMYEEMNRAVDHNLLVMTLMRKLADRHGFKLLLHEKPFKGVNGSGKHCNWSLGTDTGINLFSPGKTDEENLRFMTFTVVTLMAVYKHNALLKATVSSASNAYRLGANEAPPAIISSFLGTQVTGAFEELLKSKDMVKMKSKSGYKIGIPQIPELLLDNTDRNRTSPFAFTGNRFEFRAVGSSANCASSMAVLNAVVAYELREFKAAVEKLMASGMQKEQAILSTVKDYYSRCKDVCFDGNGYSEEWKKEAARRGLDCETSVPLIYDNFLTESTKKVLSETGVMSSVELEARTEVYWEIYCKKVEIEARIISDLTQNHIIPTATKYQSVLLDTVYRMKAVFDGSKFEKLSSNQVDVIEDISYHISEARDLCYRIDEECDRLDKEGDMRQRAIDYHDVIVPMMDGIRKHADDLEMIVDDEMWPLPKYRELLFIR